MSSLRIEAEEYDSAFDKSKGNIGKAFRNDYDVDIFLSGEENSPAIGWTEAGEFLTYNINVAESGTYRLGARVASAIGGNKKLEISVGGQTSTIGVGNTGSWQSWQTIAANNEISLLAGTYQLKATMLDGGFNLNYLDLVKTGGTTTGGSTGGTTTGGSTGGTTTGGSTSGTTTGSNTGTTIRIQAEDYDSYFDKSKGNIGKAYKNDDVDIFLSGEENSPAIGWTEAGEFLTYNINVAESGTYRLGARVASAIGGNKKLEISVGGQTSTIGVGDTGSWQSWQTVTDNNEISLSAGTYQLKATMLDGGFNLNYLDLVKTSGTTTGSSTGGTTTGGNTGGTTTGGSTSGTTTGGSSTGTKVRTQAEDYDSYFDKTPGNIGNAYRKGDVDIFLSGEENSPAVGWTEAGESLTYNINIAEAGIYRLDARVASAISANKKLEISLGGQTSTIGVGSTGGWQSWQTVTNNNEISLSARTYQLKATMLDGGFNLNYLDLVKTGNLASPNLPPNGSIDFGNIIKSGTSSKAINGDPGITSVDYSQSSKSVAANLNNGIATYGLKSLNGGALKILPLGDSITQGVLASDKGAYRDDLWGMFNNNGYRVDFVGDRSTGDGSFDKNHAGVPGERIFEVENRINNGLLDTYKPDAILLMIGTNDYQFNDDFINAPKRLDNLIGKISSLAPSARLFVSSIPPIADTSEQYKIANFNNAVSGVVKNYSNVTFVDSFSRLRASDIEDKVHPTPEGNHKIAEAWFDALQTSYANNGLTTTYSDSLNSVENIIGSNYDDVLTGNGAANILYGGKGNDILIGGGGGDKFVLSSGNGFDTIIDFRPGEDKILLDNGLRFDQVAIFSGATTGHSANDTVIFDNSNNEKLALLSGIKSELISANNFLVV